MAEVGRPTLPKGHAKTGVLQDRLTVEDSKRVEQAAKTSKQTVSEWVRGTINAAL